MALRRNIEVTDKIGFYGVDVFRGVLSVHLFTGDDVNGVFTPDPTKQPQIFHITDEPEQTIQATINIVNGTANLPSSNNIIVLNYVEGTNYTVSGLVLTSINIPDGITQIQYTKPAIPRFSRLAVELLANVVALDPNIDRYDDTKNRIWAELTDMGVVPAGSYV